MSEAAAAAAALAAPLDAPLDGTRDDSCGKMPNGLNSGVADAELAPDADCWSKYEADDEDGAALLDCW